MASKGKGIEATNKEISYLMLTRARWSEIVYQRRDSKMFRDRRNERQEVSYIFIGHRGGA